MKNGFSKVIVIALAALILGGSAFAAQQVRRTEQTVGAGFGGSIAQLRKLSMPEGIVAASSSVAEQVAKTEQETLQSAMQPVEQVAAAAMVDKPAAANARTVTRRPKAPAAPPAAAEAAVEALAEERRGPANPFRLGASRDYTLLTRLVVVNAGAEVSTNISLEVPLVTSNSLYFRENGERFSLQPSEIKTVNGTRVGVFVFNDLAPGQEEVLEIRSSVRTSMIEFFANYLSSGGNEITAYLSSGDGIESNHPQIIGLAAELTQNRTTDWEKAQAISRWVAANIRYDSNAANRNQGALQALQARSGVCEDYAKLAVALARAANIPARVVYGYTDNGTNWPANGSFALRGYRHAWVEFHLKGRGWVPAEPTRSSATTLYFGRLPHNRYIIQNYSNISLRGSHRGGKLSISWTDSLE